MSAPIATASIRIEPELDLAAFGVNLRASIAAELRRIADELHTEEPPKPPRYELVKDRTGDYGIRDTELDIIADYEADEPEEIAAVRRVIDRLNSGTIERRDIDRRWRAEHDLYPPYTVVTD